MQTEPPVPHTEHATVPYKRWRLAQVQYITGSLLPGARVALCAVLFLFASGATTVHAQTSDIRELKKEADRRFQDEDYDGAYKMYAQLVSNFPKEPEYSYRLGVCMIYSEPDKKKALPYLKNAAAGENAPEEALFYLGKAYHVNYRFDEAIGNYVKFKENASEKLQKRLRVDREIEACRNGKRLLSNLTDLVVQNKKTLNEADYFRSYELRNMGGKLLVKPDEFKTQLDKKKKDRSVIFLPKNGDLVYFSSYGESGNNGRDIYTAARLPGGGFGKPQVVSGINTPFDEDYPFLHPDGKTLYFASKGHNSMGGYDIFRSVFNENTGSWSQPENLEFPVNSPDDDFLYVTDSLQQTAFFSTGRQSAPGKIDVLKIKTERKPIDVIVIAGMVEPEKEEQSVESTITVKDLSANKNISIVSAEPNGDYLMELPNAGRLLFTVATPGLGTQSQEITLPLAKTSVTYKQTITYENGKLKILNDFDAEARDDNYLKYLAVIEKKAQLDVNEGQNQLDALETEPSRQNRDTGTPRPTVVSEETASPGDQVNNRELAQVARQDAQESAQEAAQLKADALEARKAGEKQKQAADAKLSEAAQAITDAEKIEAPEERKTAIAEAEKMMADAKNEQVIAGKVLELANTLSEDATGKQREAELNREYADELDKVVVSANPASLKRLEEIRQELDALATAKKDQSRRGEEIRSSLAARQEQAARLDSINAGLRKDLDETALAITAKEQELAATRKKKKRTAISEEIDNLRATRTEKEHEIAENDAELESLREDIAGLETDLQLAGGVIPKPVETGEKADEPVAVSTNSVPTATPESGNAKTTEETPSQVSMSPPQLDEIEKTMAAGTQDDVPLAQFTDERAKQLNAETEAALSDVEKARTELQQAIVEARTALPAEDPAGMAAAAADLQKQADELLATSSTLRQEARQASGTQKEEKNRHAQEKEELANDKLIEASQITAHANDSQFRLGDRNLQRLVAAGKGSEEDRSQALQLNGEAELALIQAAEIRKEAETLPSKGARLGNLANAEEKEAEALLKQQQAIELLKTSNPEVTLEYAAAPADPGRISESVTQLLKKQEELRVAEKRAYTTAFEARDAEITFLKQNKPANPQADRLIAEATQLRNEGSGSALKAAVKKMDEAIGLLSADTATPEPLVTAEPQQPEAAVTPTAEPMDDRQEPKTEPTPTVQTNRQDSETQQPVTQVAQPSRVTDTTTAAAVFRRREGLIADEQSKRTFENAVEQLTNAELALSAHEATTVASEVPASEVNKHAEELIITAEKLSTQADQLRQAALSQSGTQKETTLAQAAALDEQAQQSLLKAGEYSELTNIAQITSNDLALGELLSRLRTDDATTASELESQLQAIDPARSQARDLRDESHALSNAAQKLGGMGNAEEREREILAAQEKVLQQLRSKYPDFRQSDPTIPASLEPPPAAILEKQSAALTSLTNAFNLEFEKTRPAAPPVSGNADLKSAFDKNAASKQMLVEAMREQDPFARAASLRQAARLAADGLAMLKKAPATTKPVAATTTVSPKPTATVTPGRTNTVASIPRPSAVTTGVTARVEGLEVIRGNAYNASKPIPFDVAPGEGLMFRVQIGAFRSKLPDDAFRGLSPLNGETTANGYFRYTAGNFNRLENANAVKNDLRSIGYDDAFVVAYFNGRRISVSEALAILAREGRTIDPAAPQTAGITANTNIPKPSAVAAAAPAVVTQELEQTNGLLYTIQVGVYNRQVSAGQLFNLRPVFRENAGSGLFRFTAGSYADPQRALADKKKVVSLGIRDAFVSAYINGKRVPFAEALQRQQSDPTIKTGTENPVIFPGATAPAANTVQPFRGNVTAYPPATADNGVKTTEEGITFKVQIGAFSKEIPSDLAARFSQIRDWPIENKRVNDLFIYNVGNFSEARFARALRNEAVRLGIADAFVTVYRDGRKLYGSEAAALLSR